MMGSPRDRIADRALIEEVTKLAESVGLRFVPYEAINGRVVEQETFTRPQLLKAIRDAQSRFELAGQAVIEGLKRENKELRAALVPFANCVFADNGDITVDSGRLCAGDFLRAAMLTTFDARPPISQESGGTG